MPRSTALFAVVLLALAGSNAMQIWSQFYQFLFTEQLPGSAFFAVVFWFWFVTAVGTLWCGVAGGYSLLRTGNLRSIELTLFTFMSGFILSPSHHELGYSSVRVGINLFFWDLGVGVNVLGFAHLAWLIWLRGDDESALQSQSPGHGTV